ncbi:hypothetical protein CC80DRAFT_489248 [Byssothecium circinans]|uniref:F-box domain-containing protein n=1 Tax=Byssothecium circinans TaxID=147558 RepID=A0A6A5U8K1_9PLEO|nr:hypothetical protein CC80DRAFT_489248 [Byssothecium circinans]
MSLLDLPVEILDTILDLSLPSGLEGLVLSCRAIYERAGSQIRRHNELKRKWRHTTNHQSRRVDNTIQILYEISREPLAAKYIEELDLWDDRWRADGQAELEDDDNTEITEVEATPETFRRSQEAMRSIKTLVTNSLQQYDTDVDLADFWEHMMKEELHPENEDFLESSCTVIGLLSLLPNVRTLRLPGWWEGVQEEAGNALNQLVAAANRNGSHDKPLGKLTTILPSMHGGYEEKTSLQDLLPLLTLQSLTEVYLVSTVAVDDGYTGMPFSWPSGAGVASSLKRLELVSCCIDAEGLSGLIAYTPNLTIFKYSHETKHHGCQHDWNPGTFTETLGRHCGSTLIEVALTIDDLHGTIINGASSFLSFPRLEKVEVDVQIFCGPPVESGQRRGPDAFVPEGERPWSQHDIPCIGSMLPDSVREVQINVDHPEPDEEALRALLKNLKTQRAERLHRLERAIVRQYGGSSTMEMVTSAGATMEAFDKDVDAATKRRRMDMPEWKRIFHERVARLQPREIQ